MSSSPDKSYVARNGAHPKSARNLSYTTTLSVWLLDPSLVRSRSLMERLREARQTSRAGAALNLASRPAPFGGGGFFQVEKEHRHGPKLFVPPVALLLG